MAKSENNIVTHGLSGKIGDLLVFRQIGGKTIVSNAPRKSNSESESQKEHRRKFQRAVMYAKAAQSQPGYGETATHRKQTPYIVAVADFLNAPDIENVDISGYKGQPGDTIRVRVTDDFAVAWVSVRITNSDGSLVEETAAQSSGGYEWTCTATQTNDSLEGDKIEVFASDTPGNYAYNQQEL